MQSHPTVLRKGFNKSSLENHAIAPTKKVLQNVLHEMVVTKGDLLLEEVKSFHVFLITGALPRLAGQERRDWKNITIQKYVWEEVRFY